jgi:hypothetical protein
MHVSATKLVGVGIIAVVLVVTGGRLVANIFFLNNPRQ